MIRHALNDFCPRNTRKGAKKRIKILASFGVFRGQIFLKGFQTSNFIANFLFSRDNLIAGKSLMKIKIILTMLILFGAGNIFGQVKKAETPKAETKMTEREKFDPLRNANEDLQSAIATAQKENKRIILDIGGEWCGWCRLMDNYLIKNVELGKLKDENYVWLKVNFSEENENKEFLANYPEIKGYPHLFVLERDGTLLKSKETSELEDGKSYSLQKFVDFLKEYAPTKKDSAK